MLVKVLYVILIFLFVRLIYRYIGKIDALEAKVKDDKKSKQENEDIIEASFKVVKDEDESK